VVNDGLLGSNLRSSSTSCLSTIPPSLKSSPGHSAPVTGKLGSIWTRRDNIALTGRLSRRGASRGIPHDEGASSQCPVHRGPAILKTDGQR